MLTKQTDRPTFFVSSTHCGPDCCGGFECVYKIAWQINPHMRVGAGSSANAVAQHRNFVRTLIAAGARVVEVPFVHGAFDSVFVKDSALLHDAGDGRTRALLAKPKTPQRRAEQIPRARALAAVGVQIEGSTKMHFEGGDLLILPRGRGAFLGYGFRTQWRAAREIEDFLDAPVTTLQLVDPHFYHLDVALNVLSTDEGLIAFALKEAFTPEAWSKLNHHEELTRVVPVRREETLAFGLNWVEVGSRIIVGAEVPHLTAALAEYGREVIVSPLGEFNLAGGSAACLVARVHDDAHLTAHRGLREEAVEQNEIGRRDQHERRPGQDRRHAAHAKHAH